MSKKQHTTRAQQWSVGDRVSALRRCSLFSQWPPVQIEKVAAIARVEHYPRGAAVFRDDPDKREVLVVASGGLEISRGSVTGKKFVLAVIGPHTILSLVRLLPGPEFYHDYVALDGCSLLHLPADELIAILNAEPLLWRDVALLMCARQGDSLRQMGNQQLGSLEQRVAGMLGELASVNRVDRAGGTELDLQLSQDKLAAMLGASRQRVNLILRNFRQAGLIATSYNRITIFDLRALDLIAEQLGNFRATAF